MSEIMRFWSLKGLLAYEEVRSLQHSLVDLRSKDLIPDTVLFLEHQPVITRGRGLQFTGEPRDRQMPLPSFLPPGIAFSESERGGDLTYHGPGQWVVYPICKLDGSGLTPRHDIGGFLRQLENLLIEELGSRGVLAGVKSHATGVWIQSEKKVASIGMAVRKWVSYHGFALNCVNDLSPFHLISPCGFSPEVMTRLADWTSLREDWRDDLERSFARRWCPNAPLVPLELSEALASSASQSV